MWQNEWGFQKRNKKNKDKQSTIHNSLLKMQKSTTHIGGDLQNCNAGTGPLVCKGHHCIYAELHQEKKVSSSFKKHGHSKAWTWLSFLWIPVRMSAGCWHTETLLTSISMSTYLPHPTANVDMSLGLRNERSEILGVKHCETEGLEDLGGICKHCKIIFFLLHFKCIVTKEKSTFLFLQQCELTQGTNTKLGLLLFKLL